jgi:dTDP-4-amino-4,6-dideoxygalactose transaminase
MLISQQKLTPRLRDFIGKTNKNIVRQYLSKEYFYWTGSGREALKQILLNIGKKRVGVPAYTCHVVLGAVKRAGCVPVFYDSGVVADIKDIKKVIKKVDVLIVSYNFGFLPKVDQIVKLCRKNKVILIEDCAQAFGATYNGELTGSFGDYAFYSFGISKNIGFCGGLASSNKKLEIKDIKKFPISKLIKISMEALVSNLFFNKRVYHLTKKSLGKELIKKQEALSYSLPGFAKKVVLNQFMRYNQILKARKRGGEYCLMELKEIIDFVEPVEGSDSAWLYFTILSKNKRQLINKLLKDKVELGEMKTFRCLDGKSRKALEAESNVVTFALYRNFKEIKFIADKIKKVCKWIKI